MNAWSCTSIPNTSSRRGVQLKHRDNFTFTFSRNITKMPNQGGWIRLRHVAHMEEREPHTKFLFETWRKR